MLIKKGSRAENKRFKVHQASSVYIFKKTSPFDSEVFLMGNFSDLIIEKKRNLIAIHYKRRDC